MNAITISPKKIKKLILLSKCYNEIYGDENTVWDFDDVEQMRKVGDDFMEIVLKQIYKKKK